MAEIIPFVGTRYEKKIVGDIGKVVCPPYDLITPEVQDEFYRRHRYNFVRLVMGKDLPTDDEFNNRYERAARYFREWKADGVLIDDEEMSLYLCEQEFEIAKGVTARRRGFFAAIKLEEGPKTSIRAHEETFPGPKADRLKLLRATQCNLSPVFVLSSDPERRLTRLIEEKMKKKPAEQFVDYDGVKTRLWICQSPSDVQRFQEAVRNQSLLIADGHHRYETACAYRAEMHEALHNRHENMPFDYMMMFLTSMADEGLVILPTHRALTPELASDVDLQEVYNDLERYFQVERITIDLANAEEESEKLLAEISRRRPKQVRMGMILPNGTGFILTLKPDIDLSEIMPDDDIPPAIRDLDVSVLHRLVINQIWIGNPEMELEEEDVIYSRDPKVILEKVRRRKACVGFLLNAPTIEQVREIAEQGLRMPPKSTFFYPKIPSGIVSRDISRH